MKPLTREWVDKAEGDSRSAARELEAPESPNYDDVCFHAQQCAEKYMKAVLQEQDVPIPKTHDLLTLLGMLSTGHPSWEELRDRLEALTDYAVDLRYPGAYADMTAAVDAAETARQLRRKARLVLGLET